MAKYRIATVTQVVWACDQCPHAHAPHGEATYVDHCGKTSRDLLKSKRIPKWCPLPEKGDVP